MSEFPRLIVSLVVGVLLGGFFFGGLWWTVRYKIRSPNVVAWLLGGLIVRITVVMVGFLLVASGRWERILVCLAGFVMSRMLISYVTQRIEDRGPRQKQEASHASKSR